MRTEKWNRTQKVLHYTINFRVLDFETRALGLIGLLRYQEIRVQFFELLWVWGQHTC